MDRISFLKYWFENKLYQEKAACQSLFSIILDDPDSSGAFKKVPGAIYVEDGVFKTLIDGVETVLEGDVDSAYVIMDTYLNLPNDFHPIFKGNPPKTTTFGLLLFNVIMFWDVFGDAVDYVNKRFTETVIKDILDKHMVDTPPEGESLPEGIKGIEACLRLTEHANFLSGLSAYYVVTPGVSGFTASDVVTKRKKELLAEHKDSLNDPVVLTAIMDELVDLDRKEQLKAVGGTFYINDKFINTARKRMFSIFGIELNEEDGTWVPLTNSLDEGVDPKEIVTYINTAVAGAESRSKATGEGGANVKDVIALIGRVIRDLIDCGSKNTESVFIYEETAKRWMGSYYSDKGKNVVITKENISSIVGKTVNMRVPQYCLNGGNNFCLACLGNKLGSNPARLTADVVLIPTAQMLQRMKAHHTAGLNNKVIDLKTAIKE